MYDSKRMNKHSQNIHNVQFIDVLNEENIQDYNARGVAVQRTAQYQKRSGLSALNGKVERPAPMIFFSLLVSVKGIILSAVLHFLNLASWARFTGLAAALICSLHAFLQSEGLTFLWE